MTMKLPWKMKQDQLAFVCEKEPFNVNTYIIISLLVVLNHKIFLLFASNSIISLRLT